MLFFKRIPIKIIFQTICLVPKKKSCFPISTIGLVMMFIEVM